MHLPLKNVAEILAGYQSRTGIDHDPSGTHVLIQARDLTSGGSISSENLLRFTPERDAALHEVIPSDILFQARGAEHLAWCIREEIRSTLASGAFYIIRPDVSKVHPHYLAWLLNQRTTQRLLQSASQASTVAFVSKSVLLELELDLPDIDTQETIAKIIDLHDREMGLRQQIMARRSQLITESCLAGTRAQGA